MSPLRQLVSKTNRLGKGGVTMNTPEIRFKGYTLPWVQRKLGEVFEQTTEFVNPKEADIELWSLTVESGLTPKTERYNREFLVKKEDAFKVVSPGEFIYNPMNMTLGATDLNTTGKKVAVSGYYITMRTNKEHCKEYFSVWLKSPKAIKSYKLYATGGLTEKQRVQFPTLSNIETSMPSLPEQTAIGSFFRTLDTTITLHQCKLDGLRKLKKAYLQQMFPQDGERVPRVRFAGFSGEWKDRKIGDIFQVTRGQVLAAPRVSAAKDSRNIYPVYSSQTKNNGLLGYYNDFLFDTAITWTTDGANAGTVNFRKGKFYSTNVNGVLLSQDGYANPCVAEALNMIAWKYVSKVGNPKLMNNIMAEIVIILPSVAEQIVIGSFFCNLDKQINAQSQKLEQLKQLKSAYLQKMFI